VIEDPLAKMVLGGESTDTQSVLFDVNEAGDGLDILED
jgi:hypothetical protein